MDDGRASAGLPGCRTTLPGDNLVFSEYFHGDNGAGLGASHQTGWTGLIADVIRRRHGALPSTGEVLAAMGTSTPRAPSAAPSQ
jgi:hypothetical protein